MKAKDCSVCRERGFLLRWVDKTDYPCHWVASKDLIHKVIGISFHSYQLPGKVEMDGDVYEYEGGWSVSPNEGAIISFWALRRLRSLIKSAPGNSKKRGGENHGLAGGCECGP